MRRVRYGVGMSLDGFIADLHDGTKWMTGDPGYDSKRFFASLDTVLVGRRDPARPGRPFLPSPGQTQKLKLTYEHAFPSGLLVLHYDIVK